MKCDEKSSILLLARTNGAERMSPSYRCEMLYQTMKGSYFLKIIAGPPDKGTHIYTRLSRNEVVQWISKYVPSLSEREAAIFTANVTRRVKSNYSIPVYVRDLLVAFTNDTGESASGALRQAIMQYMGYDDVGIYDIPALASKEKYYNPDGVESESMRKRYVKRKTAIKRIKKVETGE